MNDRIELEQEKSRYRLICFSNETNESSLSNFVTEHNCFSEDGMFDSIDSARRRNEEMGSRWVFYPFRVIVDEEGTIVSLEDLLWNKSFIGCNCVELKETIQMLIDDLNRTINSP